MNKNLRKVIFFGNAVFKAVPRAPLILLDFCADKIWPSEVMEGIIVTDPNPATHMEFFSTMRSVLSLLRKVDERRFNRVQHEIRRVVNMPVITGAEYARPMKVCSLDLAAFSRITSGNQLIRVLACVLVHESIHGFLCGKYIPQTRGNNNRIERVCCREMNRIADKLGFRTEGWVLAFAKQATLVERITFLRSELRRL